MRIRNKQSFSHAKIQLAIKSSSGTSNYSCDSNLETLSPAGSRRYWPSIQRASTSSIRSPYGVHRIQGNFEPMQRQVESWRQTQISDAQTKLICYSAFVDGKLDTPRGLLPEVHRHYLEPQYPEFSPRTMWSLSNAFTSAFKKLDPIPQFN